MLTEFFSVNENAWRVIGITKEALLRFKDNDFKKKSRMGINRSHINNRSDCYSEMLNTDFTHANEWWDFNYDNDETILAISQENKSNRFSEVFDIDEDLGLFKKNKSFLANASF